MPSHPDLSKASKKGFNTDRLASKGSKGSRGSNAHSKSSKDKKNGSHKKENPYCKTKTAILGSDSKHNREGKKRKMVHSIHSPSVEGKIEPSKSRKKKTSKKPRESHSSNQK